MRKPKTKKERKRTKKIRLHNKKLCKKYPFILPKSAWDGKIPKDYDYTYTEYDCLLDGWQIGFGKFWLEDLRKVLVETGRLNRFYFLQLKEKYGSLRQYSVPASRQVFDVMDKYEFISEYVCSCCGSPKAVIVNCYGWFRPMCEECWDKNNLRLSKLGIKIKPYKDVADPKDVGLPNTYCYNTYANGKSEKIAVDISETTNKIWEAYERRTRNKNSSK